MEHLAYFELNFRPNVALVSVVRRFVSDFYEKFLHDPDGTSRVALATHELLENAVKYSKDGETMIRIELEATEPKQIRIVLRNRASEPHIAAIRSVLSSVQAAATPAGYYQELIAAKSKTRGSAGLGLARICAEAEMQLTHRVEQEDVAVIEAITHVGERN